MLPYPPADLPAVLALHALHDRRYLRGGRQWSVGGARLLVSWLAWMRHWVPPIDATPPLLPPRSIRRNRVARLLVSVSDPSIPEFDDAAAHTRRPARLARRPTGGKPRRPIAIAQRRCAGGARLQAHDCE